MKSDTELDLESLSDEYDYKYFLTSRGKGGGFVQKGFVKISFY